MQFRPYVPQALVHCPAFFPCWPYASFFAHCPFAFPSHKPLCLYPWWPNDCLRKWMTLARDRGKICILARATMEFVCQVRIFMYSVSGSRLDLTSPSRQPDTIVKYFREISTRLLKGNYLMQWIDLGLCYLWLIYCVAKFPCVERKTCKQQFYFMHNKILPAVLL